MSLRRGLAWMTLSQGGFFIMQFGGSVVLARLLTPYEMGVYAVAAAITGALGVIQYFGLSGFLVREHELTPELLASTFTVNTALAVVLAVAVAGFSQLGGEFLHEAGVARVMLVLSVMPLIGALEFLPATCLERLGRFRAIAVVSLVRMVMSTATTIALAFAGFSYMSIAYGGLVGALVSVAGFNWVGREFISLRPGVSDWRRVTRFGVQMLAISGVNAICSRSSEFLLGRLLGLSALGLYSRASSLNSLLWDNIHIVIGRVVFVDFADLHRRGISLRESYLRTVEIVTALLWPAFCGFATLAGPLIVAVYGDKWVGAALPLAMLSIAAVILVSITMTWEVFVVCQETARQARFEVVRTGFGLLLFVAGCFVNLTTAAAARIGEAILSLFLYRPHLERMTETSLRDFLPIYLRSASLTAAAIAPAMLLMAAHGWSSHTPLSHVAAAIVLGMAAWLLGLRLSHHPLFAEITRLLQAPAVGRYRAAARGRWGGVMARLARRSP